MKLQASLLGLAIASALAFAPAQAANGNRADIVNRANALVSAQPAILHSNAGDRFVVRDVVVDRLGTEHVRYDRTWNGLPVLGGDFIMHSRNGQLTGVSQTLQSAARPNLTPRISADQAIVEAGAKFGMRFSGVPTSRMVIYARGATPVLAHDVVYEGIKQDQTPTRMHYIVDANSGKILDRWDDIHTNRTASTGAARPGPGRQGGSGACTSPAAATGTGASLFLGSVTIGTTNCGSFYQMVDRTRGSSAGYNATHDMNNKTGNSMGDVFTDADNAWGSGTLSNRATVAVDAHYGIAMTWDYYKNKHSRNGIDGIGTGAISRVHYGNNYGNAFWSDGCYCMTFGDGDNGATIYPLVSLDVAGHEMSHGVTSRTANLTYSGESGGLNEATSDIFGTMVEFYANNASDPGDYVMGEELFPNNSTMSEAIRWMFKPSLDSKYGSTYSPDCYSGSLGSLDVHYSSGVANHFFYLLAEGAVVPAGFGAGTWANLTPSSLVCNGNIGLTGIGKDKAAAIWYVALTTQFTSSTNYAQARTGTLAAASTLYGAGSAEYNAVNAAWAAVNVNAAPVVQQPLPQRRR